MAIARPIQVQMLWLFLAKQRRLIHQIPYTGGGPKKQLHTFGKDKALSLSAPKIIPTLEAKCLLEYKYKRQWSL